MREDMQVIEFNSVVKDGAIPIPEQYKEKITSAVRVIVFSEEDSKGFAEVLKKLRSNTGKAPNLEEITNEVESVRAKRHEK